MALQKLFTFPTFSGNYITVKVILWCPDVKEAEARFMLYPNATVAAAGPAGCLGQIASLNLDGAKFDQYLGKAALTAAAAAPGSGYDVIRDQIYAAAKAEPLRAGLGLTSVSFADALNV